MFKRILIFATVIAALSIGAAISEEIPTFTSDRHLQRGLACNACHGVDKPTEPAPAKACLVCHESIEAVAEKTKDFEKNPHNNHLTDVSDLECTQCHQGHKADTPICHQCHEGMQFEKVEAEKQPEAG